MRVYYFSRQSMKLAAILIAATVLVTGFAYCLGSSTHASKVEEPIYQGNTGQKVVALCFNVDWGEEYIPDLLKILKNEDASATFFLTGKWAEKFPDLAKKIKSQGHCIGNHGYQHAHLNNLSPAGVRDEISQAEDIIKKATGEKPALFAPPFGEFNSTVQQVTADLGYKLIMWSIDTIDWQRPDAATIANRVLPRIHNDAIILMHPTQPTVEALPQILKELGTEGYRFVTVSDIIQGPPDKKPQERKKKNS